MLVLRLDNLLEQSMEEVFVNEASKQQTIDHSLKQCTERMQEVDSMVEMINLKLKAEKKTKFVQFYPDMVK